jgi:uncharacterized membrane protein
VTERSAESIQALPAHRRAAPWLLAGVSAVLLGLWLWKTPPGLLGKADAVGYAICHRIDARSFHVGSRPLPLCARCTGTFLGIVTGLVTMAALGRSRAGQFPPLPMIAVLVGFVGLMGVDGVNSYLSIFPGVPHLYQPQNWLRLTTGMLEGIAIAAVVYPLFNQTLWKNWEDRPPLGRFRELGLVAAVAAIVIGLVLTDNPVVLYPLALASAAGVVAILTMLNTIILLIASRHENRAEGWKAAALPLLAGVTLALAQIALVDVVRFAIFRSWAGLVLPK